MATDRSVSVHDGAISDPSKLWAGGLPVGVQLPGSRLREDPLLDAADVIECRVVRGRRSIRAGIRP